MIHALDDVDRLTQAVRDAQANGTRLRIMGQGSKSHLLPPVSGGQLINLSEHVGVEHYAPEELVVTVRAGTGLKPLVALLAQQHQQLAFEPPQYGGGGTIGGAVAAGLAGPGRPWLGGVRDAVLGVEILNGNGQRLRFGGQVMKNVAGYDVSRLQAGACGTLGILLSVSLRVAPIAPVQASYCLPLSDDPYPMLRKLAVSNLPITALSYLPNGQNNEPGGRLYTRIAGPAAVVANAAVSLGNRLNDDGFFWHSLRDHSHEFFRSTQAGQLWRISLPFGAPQLELALPTLVEWGGALRWVQVPATDGAQADKLVSEMLAQVAKLGGFAHPFASGQGLYPQASGPQQLLEAQLRQAFATQDRFNPELVASAD